MGVCHFVPPDRILFEKIVQNVNLLLIGIESNIPFWIGSNVTTSILPSYIFWLEPAALTIVFRMILSLLRESVILFIIEPSQLTHHNPRKEEMKLVID